jgi:hypothetical protein
VEGYGKIWNPSENYKFNKYMYVRYSCQVIYYGKLTHSFPVTNGVRQGCITSPLIFILVMDVIVRRVTADKKRGIRWG